MVLEVFRLNKLVYIADDDSVARTYIKAVVEKEGYRVEAFETGDQLFIAFQRQPCDLAILDVVMPGNNGILVCEMLREISDVPVIMLSALDSDEDYASGISRGGNVYLSKPFSETRLAVNVNSLLNRAVAPKPLEQPVLTRPKADNLMTFADITIYPDQLTAYCNKADLGLTNSEFNLLVYMIENQERAISREELLKQLWDADSGVSLRATDDTVKRLRKKLSDAESTVSVSTVWGFGFRLSIAMV